MSFVENLSLFTAGKEFCNCIVISRK